MPDYISREAAISKLRLVEVRDASINFPGAMLSELKSIPTADVVARPRWIPVTERLPEKFQPVWVACKMDGRENWTFDTIYDPYLECPWGPYYYLEKGKAVVYAWMDRSAPEPPKEEV